MRIMRRIAAVAFSVCGLAALPSHADDGPSARLMGYRCDVLRDGATTVLVCQVGEDGGPFGTTREHSQDPHRTSRTLDSLLRLLTLLDTARHDASLQQHDAVVPTPTP
jgi:hypothetical protein